MFEPKTIQDVFEYIETDRNDTRLVARVFFINNLATYFGFVKKLTGIADITIRLSDDRFCKGPDTVPDLQELIDILDNNRDKDILIPNLAEYMRVGEITERNASCIYSILNRHIHSNKRIWMPVFLAKNLFQEVVGPLDEERFGDYLVEIEDAPSDFCATVYSNAFSRLGKLVDAVGIREWLKLWDDQKICSGMSFSTRQIRQITPSDGDYTIRKITDPYEYIRASVIDENAKLSRQLGSDEQWASLIPYAHPGISMAEIIPSALNLKSFEPYSILGNWKNLDDTDQWIFFLWYKLGLNNSSDYLSYSIHRMSSNDLASSLETAILECRENSHFDEWISQRSRLLGVMGYHSMSRSFEEAFERIDDDRVKLKLLTGRNHDEKTKILEIVSCSLRKGSHISDFKPLLQEKFPDLLLYLRSSTYITGDVKEYIERYKINKISDVFSIELSEEAGRIDCLQYKTRGALLYSMKNTIASPYFLWFDGLGIEWIDMLLEKVLTIDNTIKSPTVYIGTAVLPTITKVNMSKADPHTISEKKIDDLDTLSHIKDKSDCNYYSVVVKQFDVIESIARRIVESIKQHPNEDVIVTSDHGMSRMAAKGFHSTQGVQPPAKSVVSNLGRYCELGTNDFVASITNTKREDNIIAFRTHNHFTVSGHAPGEIHGGASPEEMLVPVLHFQQYKHLSDTPEHIGYDLSSTDVYLGSNGDVVVSIQTEKEANSLAVEYCGTIIPGSSLDKRNWTVRLQGLLSGQSYKLRVYPNNLYTPREEIIYVKKKGLEIDDDF